MAHMYQALGIPTHNWTVVDLSLLQMVDITADAGLIELVLLGEYWPACPWRRSLS